MIRADAKDIRARFGARLRKLRLKRGGRIAIINAPQDYMDALGELPDDVSIEEVPMKGLDFVHLFVRDVAQLQRYGPIAIGAVRYDGVLWISYPKKSSAIRADISRDHGWDVITRAGLRPVSQISIDDTWSALRFSPAHEVGGARAE